MAHSAPRLGSRRLSVQVQTARERNLYLCTNLGPYLSRASLRFQRPPAHPLPRPPVFVLRISLRRSRNVRRRLPPSRPPALYGPPPRIAHTRHCLRTPAPLLAHVHAAPVPRSGCDAPRRGRPRSISALLALQPGRRVSRRVLWLLRREPWSRPSPSTATRTLGDVYARGTTRFALVRVQRTQFPARMWTVVTLLRLR
ncbi:hypothetical protein BD311DRAFT_130591 [Dichomitus squalens]|uniref:Uncharacterized protein n=1 Tax=Dichomitus squalens TaxID=114155 RepID=A0A4Q9M8Z7_9APHY|nr:hypothetical protein BD311DRAFT_130591 [Dichomitus squalens]